MSWNDDDDRSEGRMFDGTDGRQEWKAETEEERELQDRIEQELDPILRSAKDKARELGIRGFFVGQVGNIDLVQNDEAVRQRILFNMFNMDEFNPFLEAVENKTLPAPKDAEDVKRILAQYLMPGELVTLLAKIMQGDIRPGVVLNEHDSRNALADAIKSGELGGLSDLLGGLLGGMNQSPPRRKREPKQATKWETLHDDNGDVIGFVNPDTGEKDLFN